MPGPVLLTVIAPVSAGAKAASPVWLKFTIAGPKRPLTVPAVSVPAAPPVPMFRVPVYPV